MKKIIPFVITALLLVGCSNSLNEHQLQVEQNIKSKYCMKRPQNAKVDTCIIHCTESNDPLEMCVNNMRLEGVSYHYVIAKDGKWKEMVPADYIAYHAGASIMPHPDNRHNVNEFSVGIGLMGKVNGTPFTDEQYLSASRICTELEKKYGPLHYLGHSDVAGKRVWEYGLREDIKNDPGKNFKWSKFYKYLSYFSRTENNSVGKVNK